MTSLKAIRRILFAAALVIPVAAIPTTQAHAQLVISVGFAPPALPVYAQPICPGDGYIWTPGYWAYTDDGGYYWVPGVWVEPPTVGFLWTPAYWGWEGGHYRFYNGYWGPHVGFYGGINYGFGYGGIGFAGGEWRGGHFFYNSAVVNFGGRHFSNVYVDRDVVVHNTIVNNNHVSFNGGHGGIEARPRPEEVAAMHENHVQPTGQQMQHQNFSAQNRSQFAAQNHGRPAVAAAASPAAFHANPTNPAAAARPEGNGREGNPGQPAANNQRPGQPAANNQRPAPMNNGATARPEERQPNNANMSRPAQEPAARPAQQPAARPAPAPASRPAPASHPAPAPRPAPAQHAAPAQHSAPAPHEEKR